VGAVIVAVGVRVRVSMVSSTLITRGHILYCVAAVLYLLDGFQSSAVRYLFYALDRCQVASVSCP